MIALIVTTLLMGEVFFAHPDMLQLQSKETYVYICTGPYAKKYHKTSTCKGLDNCSESIKKVTESYAIDKGRTKCKKCYK